MKYIKILSFLLMQVSLTISLNAQSVSEYVKTNHYKYKCAYCKKIKKEDKLDIASIQNPEIANNASTYAMASAMFGSAFRSGSDICDISRTGRHRYELVSKTVTKELYTANKKEKEKIENSSSFDMDAFNKVISAGSSGDGNKKENTNNSSSFDLAASNKATQVWMTSNLDVNKFRNGDPIPEVKSTEEWLKAAENKQPAWCYYDNNPANGSKYGKLYNWYAVSDPRRLAPFGYHIPSNEEWTSFSGLPGGQRARDGSFENSNRFGSWWTSTASFSPGYAWSKYEAPNDKNGFSTIESGLMFGKSVRCLKD